MTATAPSPVLPAAALALDLSRLDFAQVRPMSWFSSTDSPSPNSQALRGLAEDPDCYGVLRPRNDSNLGLKTVSRDTALLLFSLQEAGPLPRYAAKTLGVDCAAAIGRMVLDGILEIEANGEMISGPEACALVCRTAVAPENEGRLAAISRRAIEYAAALELDDPLELSARLYSYNCIPASRRWRELLPEDNATAKYLGLVDGPAARMLSSDWRPHSRITGMDLLARQESRFGRGDVAPAPRSPTSCMSARPATSFAKPSRRLRSRWRDRMPSNGRWARAFMACCGRTRWWSTSASSPTSRKWL